MDGICTFFNYFPDHLSDELVDIYVEAFKGAPWFEDWSRDSALDCLRDQLINGDLLVEVRNASIVGMAIGVAMKTYTGYQDLINYGASLDDYYISEIAVSKNWRGHGIGKKLTSAIAEYGHRKNHPHVTLRTRSDHTTMIKIANDLGFSAIATYSAISGGVGSERVILRK